MEFILSFLSKIIIFCLMYLIVTPLYLKGLEVIKDIDIEGIILYKACAYISGLCATIILIIKSFY